MLPCAGEDRTSIASRIVLPVSCQPMKQDLLPSTIIEAEPVPPHGTVMFLTAQACSEAAADAEAVGGSGGAFGGVAAAVCTGCGNGGGGAAAGVAVVVSAGCGKGGGGGAAGGAV